MLARTRWGRLRFSFVAGLLLAAGGALAVAPESNASAARVADAAFRRGERHGAAIRQFIDEAPTIAPGGIVLLGDSLVRHFPVALAYPRGDAVNRGIGGDGLDGVLERLDICVEQLRPREVVLLIGINEFVWNDEPLPRGFWPRYEQLLVELGQAAPGARIRVVSLMPVGQQLGYAMPNIRAVNQRLATRAASHGFEWLDVHPLMVDERGYLRSEFTTDGVHLTLMGYLNWMEAMLEPRDFIDAAVRVAPRLAGLHGDTHSASAVDPVGSTLPGGRGSDHLVIYTPASGFTTGTNPWGFEAVVQQGRVTSAGGNNLRIPKEGFVVSGDGEAALWVAANLKPGAGVTLEQPEGEPIRVRVQRVPEAQRPAAERMELIRDDLAAVLAALGEREPKLAAAARDLLLQVLAARRARTADMTQLDIWAERRDMIRAAVDQLTPRSGGETEAIVD